MVKKLTLEEFIKRAELIHGNKYDYSKVIYKNVRSKIIIICKIHGDFLTWAKDHYNNGGGCPKCKGEKNSILCRKTLDQFIEDAIKVHGNKYDYSNIIYKTSNIKINILCKKCNKIFEQKPMSHLNGNGCKYCCRSKGEEFIENFLKEKNIDYIKEYKFKNQPEYIKNCEYDFYIPDKNIIIEFHGEQHYKYNNFFYDDFSFLTRLSHDFHKKNFIINNGMIFIELNKDNINTLKGFF